MALNKQELINDLKGRILTGNETSNQEVQIIDFLEKIAGAIHEHIKRGAISLPASPHGSQTLNIE